MPLLCARVRRTQIVDKVCDEPDDDVQMEIDEVSLANIEFTVNPAVSSRAETLQLERELCF